MDIQTFYQQAITFAAQKHADINQLVPGSNLPYTVHISNVAMEILSMPDVEGFDKAYAVQLALLHDTIEDTSTIFNELKNAFGIDVAKGVLALTKNPELPKEEQMQDSLNRIKKMRKEVAAVKMADRITNLQKPPANWDEVKKFRYCNEAGIILSELKEGSEYLANRLGEKIKEYSDDIDLPQEDIAKLSPEERGRYFLPGILANLNDPTNDRAR